MADYSVLSLSKNVSCTSTPQGKHLCQISWELVKNWGSSSRRKISAPATVAIICRYHGNRLSMTTVKKWCLAQLHPIEQSVRTKFHENWWKTEEVVRDARFFPKVYCDNMYFYHVQHERFETTFKKCVLHPYTPPPLHLCQISWELVKNWAPSSRRKIFQPMFARICRSYHGLTHFLPLSKNVSCTCTPHVKHVFKSIFMRIV